MTLAQRVFASVLAGVATLAAGAWLYAGYWISQILLRPPRVPAMSPDEVPPARLPFAHTWPTTHPMVVTGPWPTQSDRESMGQVERGDTILAIEDVPVSWSTWISKQGELRSRQVGETVRLDIMRVSEAGAAEMEGVSAQLIGRTRSPADLGMQFENLRVVLQSGLAVEGWHIPSRNPGAPTVIALHGHASSRHSMLDGLTPALHKAGYHVVLMDAAGHGTSEGIDSDLVGTEHIERVIDWVKKRADSSKVDVALLGHSFGGITAARAARIADVRALVLLAAPVSLRQGVEAYGSKFMHVPDWLASLLFPSLALWMWLRFRHSMYENETRRALEDFRQPLLVVQGSEDELWSPETAEKLYEIAAGPKKLLILPGHDHNSVLVAGDSLMEPLLTFLGDAFLRE